jgi:hypothetical protein
MKSLSCQFEGLADREGFNASVRHIKTVISIVDRVAGRENLADVVDELVEKKLLDKDEIRPVVSMVIGKKFPYRNLSANLTTVAGDIPAIVEELAAWNGIDVVVLYFHPDLGALAVNPKNAQRMSQIDRLNRSELLVVYTGLFTKEGDPVFLDAAAEAVIELFSGKKPKVRPDFLKGDCVYKQPKKEKDAASAGKGPTVGAKMAAKSVASKTATKSSAAAKASAAKVQIVPVPQMAEPEEPKAAVAAAQAVKPGARMTPMYSVVVANELFHNGNVEAWKRIIQSYTSKHPDLQVLVYYDSERITNLNALFKWGKVKHGSTIQFAVVGEEISDVAKLQRYLVQGASRMYEAFLRGPVNSVMALF